MGDGAAHTKHRFDLQHHMKSEVVSLASNPTAFETDAGGSNLNGVSKKIIIRSGYLERGGKNGESISRKKSLKNQ